MFWCDAGWDPKSCWPLGSLINLRTLELHGNDFDCETQAATLDALISRGVSVRYDCP